MGNMIRCPDGHFFDQEKHASCPWCETSEDAGGTTDRTYKLAGGPAAKTPDPAHRDRNRTVRLDETVQGIRPVVGWLVCVDGPDKGKDFRLHAEKNFIGRDSAMDVCLEGDASVSRSRHAVVTFEPKKKTFYVQPGDSTGLVYLNDEVVNAPKPFAAYEVIEVGATKLVIVPFDLERFPLVQPGGLDP